MIARILFLTVALALAPGVTHSQPAAPPAAPVPPVVAPDPNAEAGEDPEETEREVIIPAPGTAPPVYAGDPKAYWTGRAQAPVQIDPLGDRRARKNQPRVTIPNETPPLLYRLWGLPPLQTMVLRPGEAVMEVWVRPTGGSHEAIARMTLRRDGKVFIQARAGMGCCRPEIARRIDIDEMVDKADTGALKALAKAPLWKQPAEVDIVNPTAVTAVCAKGAAYDVTLLEYDHAAHLRRICDNEAVGSIAPVLVTVLTAALGKDPRFDALFRGGADFSVEQSEYARLLADGGSLKPKSFNR